MGTEIDEIISSGKLPDYLNKQIDAVRNIGNFAAHPIENQNSGEIVQVEADEAQWCLYLVSSLIHHFYVVIPDHEQKMAALNKKLAEAGKPVTKTGNAGQE